MKIFKTLFALLATIFILIGCIESQNKVDINLKDFFYKVDDYAQKKVLIYEHDSAGIKTNNYFVLQKINKGKLLVTRFSKDFQVIQTYTDIYKQDGVYLESLTFMEGNTASKPTIVKVKSGKIFPFDNANAEIISTSSFLSVIQPNIKGEIEDKWKLNKIAKREIDGKKHKVMFVNGNSERTYTDISTGQKSSLSIKLEYCYTEGIGLTYIKSSSLYGTFTDKYLRTISIEEFNRLKEL